MAVDQDHLDRIASSIADLYREVEASLITVVADELKKGLDAPTAAVKLDAIMRLRRAAVAVHDRLVRTKSSKIREAIRTAYRSGFGTALSTLPADVKVREDAAAALDQVPNTATIERIATALHQDLGRVEANILRAPLDAYRAVQAATAARIATGTVTRLQASQAAWKRLMDKGIASFTDRAGRQWRLSSYAEMVGRTNIARAATQGQMDRLESLDIDLVYIGDNVQECRVCRPFESRVLRRNAGPIGRIQVEHATQDDVMVSVHVIDTLAGAEARGLFHPNCRHSASVYLPGLTKLKSGTEDPEGDKARQKQRLLERKIRAAKENVLGALTPKDKQAAGADVRAAQAKLRAHLAAHPDLKRLPYRESIGAGNIPPASGPKGGAVGDFEPPKDGAPTPAATKPKPKPKFVVKDDEAAKAKAAEKARVEAERLAQEQEQAEQAERAAQEKAAEEARVEAERKAKADAEAEAEKTRLAAQEAAQAEADRLAKEQAAKPTPQPTTTPAAVPDRARDHHINLNGIEALAHAVEDGFPPQSRRALTGGVSADTELITLKDGTKVVWKSGGNPDAEQAASMIARAIGIRAPGVYRNHPSAVYMEYIDDAMTATELQEHHPGEWEKRQRASIDHDDGNLVGLLDALISNADRNTGNWMVTEDGRTIPIDHGHAFTGVPSGRIRVRKVQGDGPFAENYRLAGSNPLTQADVIELRGRLEALAPEFAHMGRSKWLEYSLGVLDLLAKDAGGYSNMIAGVR